MNSTTKNQIIAGAEIFMITRKNKVVQPEMPMNVLTK